MGESRLKRKKSKMTKDSGSIFQVLSLFSGGGFLDMGFMSQGFQIEEAIEINPHFIEAYNYGISNFVRKSENPFIQSGAVRNKTIDRIVDASNKVEQSRLGKIYKNINGVIGGPPCQDYSVGGRNLGLEGERGKLILSYLEIIKKVKPEFLLFENVVGLYKTKYHQTTFNDFVMNIEKEGYVLWIDVLNPLDYGFPQDRGRIVLVGFKKALVSKLVNCGYKLEKDGKVLKQTDDNGYVFKWPRTTDINPKSIKWPSSWDFGSDVLEDEIRQIPAEFAPLLVINAFKNLSNSIPNQDEHFLPHSKKFFTIKEGETKKKSFKRLHRFKYSPTVAYGNNEVHLHPTLPRRLTVREALRLQTVPDSYILPASLTLSRKFKLISNGVPTGKAELVANEIRRTLINYYKLIN
jgi:DNA (cytosine-5)-methyltransferase 1